MAGFTGMTIVWVVGRGVVGDMDTAVGGGVASTGAVEGLEVGGGDGAGAVGVGAACAGAAGGPASTGVIAGAILAATAGGM